MSEHWHSYGARRLARFEGVTIDAQPERVKAESGPSIDDLPLFAEAGE